MAECYLTSYEKNYFKNLVKSEMMPHLGKYLELMMVEHPSCPRCIFRFLKVGEINVYREDKDRLKQFLLYLLIELNKLKQPDEPASVLPSIDYWNDTAFVCPHCLGIVPSTDDPVFVAGLFNAITQSGYDFDDYFLAVTAPTSVQIRQYQMWYHLQATFPYVLLRDRLFDAQYPFLPICQA